MKIRLLEKELVKSGYRFHRYGKGSHRIDRNSQTSHTITISAKRGKDAQPYQLKFLRQNLELSTL